MIWPWLLIWAAVAASLFVGWRNSRAIAKAEGQIASIASIEVEDQADGT